MSVSATMCTGWQLISTSTVSVAIYMLSMWQVFLWTQHGCCHVVGRIMWQIHCTADPVSCFATLTCDIWTYLAVLNGNSFLIWGQCVHCNFRLFSRCFSALFWILCCILTWQFQPSTFCLWTHGNSCLYEDRVWAATFYVCAGEDLCLSFVLSCANMATSAFCFKCLMICTFFQMKPMCFVATFIVAQS